MKAKKLIILALALIATATAQAQVVRDADFNTLGRINRNGIARANDGRSVAVFDDKGFLHDKLGNVVVRIKDMDILDPEGNPIGYINRDGTVRDSASNLLGHIDISDGKVTDASDNVLGYARGIRVDWIACYYFFKLFEF